MLNGRQGFGPIGQLPMQNDPRNNMMNRGAFAGQSQMTQPILRMNEARLPQSQILGGRPDQKPLFGPK